MIKKSKIFIICIFALLTLSCSLLKKAPENIITNESILWPDELLKERFIDYWDLRCQQKYKKTFKLEAPYIYESVPIDLYKKAVFKPNFEIYKVETQTIHMENSSYYHLIIKVHGLRKNGAKATNIIKDSWVKAGGKWYHVIIGSVMMKHLFP